MPTKLHKYFATRTHSVRMNQLIRQVNNHPHRNELISMMQEQHMDDKFGHICTSLEYSEEWSASQI